MITSINLTLNNEHEEFKKQKCLRFDEEVEVYLIKSNNTDKQYILKRIKLDRRVEHNQVNRFTNECNALKKINNPFIIKYIHNFRSIEPSRSVNVIMEYVEGSNLAIEIRIQRQYSYLQIIEWIIYICIGLHEIHSNNIIHRNIKPDNLFLTKDNKIKIGNFGFSKCLSSNQDYGQTDIGDLHYRAPETFEEKYTNKVDMWSLGVVVFELLTFTKPYGDIVINRSNSQYIKQMKPLPDCIPIEFKELISKLLNMNPHIRPSAKEVLQLPFIKERINILITEGKLTKNLVSNLVKEEFEDGYCIYDPDEEINIPRAIKSSRELKYVNNIKAEIDSTGLKSFSSKNISAQLNSQRLNSNFINQNQNVQEIEGNSIGYDIYDNNNNENANDNINLDYVDDNLIETLSNKSIISCREDFEKFKRDMTRSLEQKNKSKSEITNSLRQIEQIYSLLNDNNSF